MIKSMTGFGHGELVSEDFRITVEMKAVNHRYCDINIKMPKKLNFIEADIRNTLKKTIKRGKVDVYISFEDLSESTVRVRLNEEMGREYFEALNQLGSKLEISESVTAWQVARFPEVLTLEDVPMNQEYASHEIMEAVGQAAEHFADSRIKEGENLKEDILGKLEGMKKNITLVEERYPQMVAEYRKKLTDKVQALLTDANIDESRIATEVVIYADKISVDEETVRLRSHIDNMKDELVRGGSVGRKLDFIAQEMNREANTILSKANDIEISNIAIELKTEVERIREQVQNIE